MAARAAGAVLPGGHLGARSGSGQGQHPSSWAARRTPITTASASRSRCPKADMADAGEPTCLRDRMTTMLHEVQQHVSGQAVRTRPGVVACPPTWAVARPTPEQAAQLRRGRARVAGHAAVVARLAG
jgi:hypothetical protein